MNEIKYFMSRATRRGSACERVSTASILRCSHTHTHTPTSCYI